MTEHAVVWPCGRRALAGAAMAPARTSLDGATIALLWDQLFRGDEMFEIAERMIGERYENVTFVPWRVFGDIHGSDAEEREAIVGLPEKLRRYRVDAALVGVGA